MKGELGVGGLYGEVVGERNNEVYKIRRYAITFIP
jgi:hypothetical protein